MKEWRDKFRLFIVHDGFTLWKAFDIFKSKCRLELALFPFDHQECSLDFGPGPFPDQIITFNPGSVNPLMLFTDNGEYDVTYDKTIKMSTVNVSLSETYSTVRYVFKLKRKPSFYQINILGPCVLMSIMGLLVFCLPNDCGEKISLEITVLLSFTVFQMVISDVLPKTSESIPVLSKF